MERAQVRSLRGSWTGVRACVSAFALVALVWSAAAHAGPAPDPLAGWRFRLRSFVIGAWLGPDGTDAELRLYKECGFNVVMVGRYMAHGQYALPDRIARELDLVRRHRLYAMLDTYTQNDKPWGGVVPPAPGTHHPSSLEELRWIHARFGRHPALAGYLIGDDQGTMSPQLVACTQFLRENAPHLIPWVCGWVPAAELARYGNPYANWQIYPTLYNTNEPAEVQARLYCEAYDRLRRDCLAHGVLPWPMFNASGADVSDSLLRFPIYAGLAYGAQGLWYFCYRGSLTNGVEGKPGHTSYAAAKADVKPNWYVAQAANRRVAAYGPHLLGAVSQALFNTGWQVPGTLVPGPDRLVTEMSDDLLAGVLIKPRRLPMVLVVDKRVSKTPGATPPREVEVAFAPAVGRVRVLDARASRTVRGNRVRLTLSGGEGMLLLLEPARGRSQELSRYAEIGQGG